MGEQQNDSWGSSSAIGLRELANEKAHRFYEVTLSNVDQMLATTNFQPTDKAFVHSYLDATNPGNFSAIVPNNRLITGFTWGNWVSEFRTTPRVLE